MHVNMVSLVLLVASVDLSAALFVEQPFPETPPGSGYRGSSTTEQRAADEFILGADSSVAAVRFWGFYYLANVEAANEAFNITFYLANGDGTGPAATSLKN